MTKQCIYSLVSTLLVFTILIGTIDTNLSQAQSITSLDFFDDFSAYTPGYPPTGYLQRMNGSAVPTIEEIGGTGPDYRLVSFPEVSWQYWDSWLLKENVVASGNYEVTVKMNFQNAIADRAGLVLAWNDANWDRIDIQPNVYWDDIEFHNTYTGPIEYQIVITTLADITINAYTDYWLRVVTQDDGPGNGVVDVFWSIDNVNFTHVLHVTGMPNLTGLVGMSSAGPHLPHVHFDEFSIKSTTILPDISLEGIIKAGNNVSPYEPNHITLFVDVKNNSTQPVESVQVSFFDGNPDDGGVLIDTTVIGEMAAGSIETVSTNWTLSGNLVDHQVFARATIIGNQDGNLGNNTISRPISIYYVDFRHDRDAYSFSNTEVGKVTLSEIFGYLADFDLPEIFWKPLLPIFGILFESNGYCYGMSNSSLVYFEFPFLIPDPDSTTYNLTLDEARGKIRTYQWYVVGPMLNILMGLSPDEPDDQYQLTLDSIRNGQPVIHGLMERNGILPEKGSHAVVAYKIIDFGDEKLVFYYDNNIPLNLFPEGALETYGVFNDSGFSEPIYANQNPSYQFNKAYVIYPQPSSSDMARILLDFVNWIFQYHFKNRTSSITVEGSVDLLAVDSSGRQTGYIDGQEVNEIPGSSVSTVENAQMLILPSTDVYQLQVTGIEDVQSGAELLSSLYFSLSIFDPTSETTSLVTEFNNASIAVNETASLIFEHGQEETEIVLPDSTILTQDASILTAPGYRIYLPVIMDKP